MDNKYYITTPIYYPSDKLHIGHAYCTVAADAMARYKRLRGFDVMFLTGTDEHGQKIEQKAKEAGITPKAFVDSVVEGDRGILDLWKLMNISHDRFIRTTDDYHVESVQKIFRRLYEQGDIYKGKYTGKYCTDCEAFWTETQLVEGNCPDCGRPVKDAEEEAYFFRLSKYADRIRDLLVNTDFLEPRSRVNEMVNNFIDAGLEDLCVSRTSFTWGVMVDFDPKHVVYVWVDALTNYINALGYENSKFDDFNYFWPAGVHFVGKEIVRFHSIIWPALLMALDLPLPEKVYGHGWLLLDGGKMSKSKGNVVDPYVLSERYGVDALRHFLLREFPFGTDGNFSNEALISRINTDLANDLGNLLSRTTAMVNKYFGGTLPAQRTATEGDNELLSMMAALPTAYEDAMEKYAFQIAIGEVFSLIGRSNKYIDENAPWVLAKDMDANGTRLATVLYNLLEVLRISANLLTPFMPDSCEEVLRQIGATDTKATWDSKPLPLDVTVAAGKNLFPRIDMAKELAELEAQVAPAPAEAPAPVEAPKEEVKAEAEEVEEAEEEYIAFDDFVKVKMITCKVLECEAVKKSKKLLKFTLDDGSGTPRQILSGIHQFYEPEDLIGKTVVACANLAPRKMMGQESCGMLLSAVKEIDGEEQLHLMMLDDAVPAGFEIC